MLWQDWMNCSWNIVSGQKMDPKMKFNKNMSVLSEILDRRTLKQLNKNCHITSEKYTTTSVSSAFKINHQKTPQLESSTSNHWLRCLYHKRCPWSWPTNLWNSQSAFWQYLISPWPWFLNVWPWNEISPSLTPNCIRAVHLAKLPQAVR